MFRSLIGLKWHFQTFIENKPKLHILLITGYKWLKHNKWFVLVSKYSIHSTQLWTIQLIHLFSTWGTGLKVYETEHAYIWTYFFTHPNNPEHKEIIKI